jgi:cytosolic iron-sulfur protein assembly protein CIAO1
VDPKLGYRHASQISSKLITALHLFSHQHLSPTSTNSACISIIIIMARLVKVCELEGHQDRVWSVAFNPVHNLLASCSGDKTIRLWAPAPSTTASDDLMARPWRCVKMVVPGDHHHQRTIRRVAWNPSGTVLVAASFDATVSVWLVSLSASTSIDLKCISTLEGHENEAKSVAWNAQGNLLATCSRDKTVWIWECMSDRERVCVWVGGCGCRTICLELHLT